MGQFVDMYLFVLPQWITSYLNRCLKYSIFTKIKYNILIFSGLPFIGYLATRAQLGSYNE